MARNSPKAKHRNSFLNGTKMCSLQSEEEPEEPHLIDLLSSFATDHMHKSAF